MPHIKFSFLIPWRWRQYYPHKRWHSSTDYMVSL